MARQILIVDDHELFRSGLRALLGTVYGDEQISEADSGESALRYLAGAVVDVLVLDFDLPDQTGLEVLRQVRQRFPAVKVIMLTGSHSAPLIDELLVCGASAVLAKRGKGDELLEAIDSTEVEPIVSEAFDADRARAQELLQLTRREREALELLVNGLSTQQLADAMSVSFKTAETHKTRLMAKLQVHSSTELVLKARSLGLVF